MPQLVISFFSRASTEFLSEIEPSMIQPRILLKFYFNESYIRTKVSTVF